MKTRKTIGIIIAAAMGLLAVALAADTATATQVPTGTPVAWSHSGSGGIHQNLACCWRWWHHRHHHGGCC